MKRKRFRSRRCGYHLRPLPVILILLVLTAGIVSVRMFSHAKKNPLAAAAAPSSKGAGISSVSAAKNVVAWKGPNGVMQHFKLSKIPKGNLNDWNLILLNPDPQNQITKELNIRFVKINSQTLDYRAGDAYKKMYAAALKDGVTLYLRSGYRSIATQKANYDRAYSNYRKAGKSDAEAEKLTKQYYTVPGHSEHHTGLACDIITPQYQQTVYTLDDRFMETAAYRWLTKNSADYGFVLRYPKGKENITKINFEPWHFRYVGVAHAKFMNAHNLCLEEYLSLLKAIHR